MKQYILAIETGGTKIQMVLGNAKGEIFHRYRTAVEREKGFRGILDKLLEEMPTLKKWAKEMGGSITRIGIGFGGPVDTKKGRALWSAQIDGWKDFPVSEFFEKQTGIHTWVFNDSNAAAWGEYCRGEGNGSDIFFYTNIGSGVGGGLVIDGKLYDGQGCGAAEFGQTYLYDPHRESDGRYPVIQIEKVCSGWGIEKQLRTADIPADSLLWGYCGGDQEKVDCHMWSKGVEKGDAYCLSVLDGVAEYFAIALCNMFCFYSPQVVAIGGGVSLIGEPLISRINAYVEKYIYINNSGRYRIVRSRLGEDVVLVGTLLLTGLQKEATAET